MVRECTILAEELSVVPSIHVRQLTNTFSSRSRGSDALFGTAQVSALKCTNHTQRHIYMSLKLKTKYF